LIFFIPILEKKEQTYGAPYLATKEEITNNNISYTKKSY